MIKLDIFLLFIFVLSSVHLLNLTFNVVKNIMSPNPKTMSYSVLEKISNYLFIAYFITYIISNH
jgi:phosphate starvation-inducible membrane PsiE